jgi:preprotein translocase subunit SecF
MIQFLKYKFIYFAISAVIMAVGLFSIVVYGFNISIDFLGGTVVEYSFSKPVDRQIVRSILEKDHVKVSSLQITGQKKILIKTEALSQKKELSVRSDIATKTNTKIEVLRVETVGPVIGQETMKKTLFASLVAILGILLYMTYAFKKITYGLAAIGAMIHDFLIVIGVYSLFSHFLGAELDTLFVTALLTTMSFSIHDTIVVFDKIREYRKYDHVTNIEILANKAFTETIVRSLNNSLTIMLMLLALVLLGGETIRFFAATLLVGTITGTYSSPFIATPILAFLEKRKR